jgi:SAM-dependent methyltransferase
MTKPGITLAFLTAIFLLVLSGCNCSKDESAQVMAELAAVTRDRDKLEKKVNELTKERDTAAAEARSAQTTIKDLMNQLTEQMEEIGELQSLNEQLQTRIDELQEKFGVEAGDVNKEVEGIREPDVVFVPTPQNVVDKMLEMAQVTKEDLVYDLGCGDGRIVVTAAKKYGCKAKGYDIDPKRVRESLANVRDNGVEDLVTIEQKDIFTLDLSKANVVTLYLLPELNVKLIPQLEKLKDGSRIVSHDFSMEGVKPDKVVTLTSEADEYEHTVYLWTAPLKKVSQEEPVPVLNGSELP